MVGFCRPGHIYIRMWLCLYTSYLQNCDEKVKIERPGGQPVWSLSWNPSKLVYSKLLQQFTSLHRDHSDILAVCDWNQKLSFYQPSGRQVSVCDVSLCSVTMLQFRLGRSELLGMMLVSLTTL